MYKYTIFKAILFFFYTVKCGNGANILFYWGISSYSHRIAVWPLVEELAARGHQVTFLSPYLPKKPNQNVTEFSPKVLQDFIGKAIGPDSNMIQLRLDGGHIATWSGIQELGVGMCEILMKDPEYLKLVEENNFDLVIIDALQNECALGIVHQHKSSYIIFDTTHVFMWQSEQYGFPAETSWIPDLAKAYPQEMSFWQRLDNTLQPISWYNSKVSNMYPRLEEIMNRGFNQTRNNLINLQEMELECSLILINSHFSLDNARSLPPLFVSVAGLHIETNTKPLPKDLAKFIDESSNGFIYISFGSVAQISKVKRELQEAFFYALGNSSCRFVWKWEGDLPEILPKNVITAKWMPQNDILAHPKIKGFMTHAGLLGIEEATFHGVPLIAFPIFAEQDYNAERLNRLGYGIRLEFINLKQEQIQGAINSILTNPSYKERMTENSRLFKDRQVAPLETAVWWTEYVLRHKSDKNVLMPYGRYQSWYTRRHLDVWGLIIGSGCFVIGIFVGCCLRNLFYSLSQRVSPGKKLN